MDTELKAKFVAVLKDGFTKFNESVEENKDLKAADLMRLAADLSDLEAIKDEQPELNDEEFAALTKDWSPKFRTIILMSGLGLLFQQQAQILQKAQSRF